MSYEVNKNGYQEFLSICANIKSPNEFKQFLDLFLTIEEKETLASRFLIVKALLESKLTQREIAEIHKVSIAQITRGSNAMKIISPELKNLLKTLIDK